GAYWAQYVKIEDYHKKKTKTQSEYDTIKDMFKNSKDFSAIRLASSVDNLKLWDMFVTWIVN
ncbi:14021_t:CDS:2, partial [Dentiscutata heterogama]